MLKSSKLVMLQLFKDAVILRVCVEKTNTSSAGKRVNNVSFAVINQEQKDNGVDNAVAKSAYDVNSTS